MKYRKLRIAWSVAWGVVAVLLCVFWVRSWSMLDNLAGHLPGIDAVSCTSAYGRVAVGTQRATPPWKLNYHNAVLDENSFGGRPKGPRKWFIFERNVAGIVFQVPHGVLVLISCISAVLPWLPLERFSLRTLLIATTLVAVVLGFVVWLSRAS